MAKRMLYMMITVDKKLDAIKEDIEKAGQYDKEYQWKLEWCKKKDLLFWEADTWAEAKKQWSQYQTARRVFDE